MTRVQIPLKGAFTLDDGDVITAPGPKYLFAYRLSLAALNGFTCPLIGANTSNDFLYESGALKSNWPFFTVTGSR